MRAENMEGEASSSINRVESVIIDHGRYSNTCGYCKSGGLTKISHGLSALSITVYDYQELLDRGWRRSGSFLYKPEMESTCCPSYTIRLKAGNFLPTKEQIRVTRRMQRFLDGRFNVRKSDKFEYNLNYLEEALGSPISDASSTTTVLESTTESSSRVCREKHKSEEFLEYLSNKIDKAVSTCVERGEFPSTVQLPKAAVKIVTLQAKKKLTEISEGLLYTSNISFQIAAVLQRWKSAERDSNQVGLSNSCVTQEWKLLELSPKPIAEMLAFLLDSQGELYDLSMKACNGHLNFYASNNESAPCGASIYFSSSVKASSGHGVKGKHCGVFSNHGFPQHKRRQLEIRLKRSSFDPEEYALYRKYQIRVHNDRSDKVTESSYKRFLVETPLVFVPPSEVGTVPPCGFGSFHQQYVIDGQLVAVGVVDILPRCLSSKYLFWDPDLAFLSLGKYSALQEINWVRENQAYCPSLQYYYLGYYIHSCSKMRYKAAYQPCELLCPLRYRWVQFDIVKPLLDKKSYVVLSDFANLEKGSSSSLLAVENPVTQACSEPCVKYQIEDLSDEDGIDQIGDDSDEDEEMDPDFEADSDQETIKMAAVCELKDSDVDDIVLDLNGIRLKFKDLQRAFHAKGTKRTVDVLELRLRRYMRLVGTRLSGRIVYSL